MFPRAERPASRPNLGMFRPWRGVAGAGGGGLGASDGDRERGPCQRKERFLAERALTVRPQGRAWAGALTCDRQVRKLQHGSSEQSQVWPFL